MSIGWQLRKACRSGDLVAVKELLADHSTQPHLNDCCARGHTPLHRAASRGSILVTELLLKAGAEVDITCRFGYTALHEAACRGHADIARALLKAGANPNLSAYSGTGGGATERRGWTPLFVASRHGHANVVHELLDHGADVDRCDDGWTCLHSAASGGFDPVVCMLLQRRPDLTIITKGTFWFETAEEVARLASTRHLLRTYRRELYATLVGIALAYHTHSTSNKRPQPSNIFSLPIDVLLLILCPLGRKDFARHEIEVELLFRFAISGADEWRTRIKHREALTVQKYKRRNSGIAKLRFKDAHAHACATESQGEEGAMHA